MTTQINSQTIETFARDHTAVALAPNVVFYDHAQGRAFRGRAEVGALLRAFYVGGFPGAQADVHSIIANDTTAVLEFTFRGRQEGPFMGILPTGREVVLPITIVFQLLNGQIRSANLYYDAGTLLRQLGLANEMAEGLP